MQGSTSDQPREPHKPQGPEACASILLPSRGRDKFPVSQNVKEGDGRDLRPPCASLLGGPDSAAELWELDTQDASSQALGGNDCVLGEEAGTPQSAGGSLGAGLQAPEPTVLLPGVDTPPESAGEELLDSEAVGALWICEGYLGPIYPYKIMVKSKGFGFY